MPNPTLRMSPQAYRRLRATMQEVELADLADEIADALRDRWGSYLTDAEVDAISEVVFTALTRES